MTDAEARAFFDVARESGYTDDEIAAEMGRRMKGSAATAAPVHVAPSEVAAGPRPRQMPWDNPDEVTLDRRPEVAAAAMRGAPNKPTPRLGDIATDTSNMARTAANTVSAGAYNAFTDALRLTNPQDRAQLDAETNARGPLALPAAQFAGMASPVGVPAMLARSAGAIAKPLAEAAPRGLQTVARLAGGAGSGALQSGGLAASESAFAGKDPYEVFKTTLDAMKTGAAWGLGGQAVAETAGGVGSLIRSTKAGQARTLTEQNAGRVTALGGQGGIPELKNVETTRRNMGEVQRAAGKEISQALESEFQRRFGNSYRMAKAEAEAPVGPNGLSHADTTVDLFPLYRRIAEVAYSEKTPRYVASYLKSELDRISERGGKATWRQLEEMKQRFQNDASYGVPGGPGTGNVKEESLRAVANAATDLSARGPYGRANAIYKEGMDELRKDRSLMGLKDRPGDVQIGEKAIGRWAGRAGEDTITAGLHAPAATHEQFKLRHPELGRTVDMPNLLRAKAALEFGVPGAENLIAAHGGLAGKAAALVGHNLGALGARSLGPIERMSAQPPLQLQPGSAFAQPQTPMPHIVNRLVAAAQQKRLEDQYTIESIFGSKNTNQGARLGQ